jgi:hypothetical protein
MNVPWENTSPGSIGLRRNLLLSFTVLIVLALAAAASLVLDIRHDRKRGLSAVRHIGGLCALGYILFLLVMGFFSIWMKQEGAMWTLLPGGGLLMGLLGLNMICGGITKLSLHIWNRMQHGMSLAVFSLIGVLIAHISVVVLLVAGLVSLLGKKEGAVWVTEGAQVNEFDSFHRSAIQIEKLLPGPADGKRKAMVIPDGEFDDLTPESGEGKSRTFTSKDLPFDLVVMNYLKHSNVRRARKDDPESMVVDGYVLQDLPPKDEQGKPVEHERMLNGAYVKAIDKKTGAEQKGILWRQAAAPWSVKIGDEVYGVTIGRTTLPLPFTVRLDKFIREVHPGTGQARKFTSHVTVTRDGREEKKVITMNEPLRYGGFAFFQSSFDSEAAQTGGLQSSMFQVASNPSDHWPLYSLLAAMLGLMMNLVAHFLKFAGRVNQGTGAAAIPAKTTPGLEPPPIPPA